MNFFKALIVEARSHKFATPAFPSEVVVPTSMSEVKQS